MMFCGGAIQLIATIAYWSLELLGRYTGLWAPFETTVPGTFAHAYLMVFGLFPFFIFGFLMTTYPKWMPGGAITTGQYVGAFLGLLGGALLFYLGLFTILPIAILGVFAMLVGWGIALYALLKVYFTAQPGAPKRYEPHLNAALSAGWFGILLYLLWLLTDAQALLQLSLLVGLWLFLVPLVLTVAHRMIPYFSSVVLSNYRVVQPSWSFPVIWVGVSGHALLEFLGAQQWLFLFDLPLLVLGVHHTLTWGLNKRAMVNKLLAVLHLAFVWFGIGMALYVIQSLVLLTTGEYVLARAPLHAVAIGFLAALTLAMASRVTLGHSGNPMILGTLGFGFFITVQVAAALRIFAEVPAINDAMPLHLNVVAALLWLVGFTGWVVKFAPIYLKPRADGLPG